MSPTAKASSPPMSNEAQGTACPLCASELEVVFRYDEPPAGETRFPLPASRPYRREFRRCRLCGHLVNVFDFDLGMDYQGPYAEATYGDRMLEEFRRIMSIPAERSDNSGRVRRIVERLGSHGRLLDVGSGLGVFPARMREQGWECIALDPDARVAAHLTEHAGVESVCTDFMLAGDLGAFDLVTFNKVLEHVADPVGMLRRARDYMRPGGTVYVEVPDGELAAHDGPEREEFFFEHACAFSMTSLSLLADRAGFTSRAIERLREPSDKYTLYAFLQ
jgi:SAM-dependent methyltransferase